MRKAVLLAALCLCFTNCHAQSDGLKHGKIPIDSTRWYQLNNVSNGLGQLFDGNTVIQPNTGWGKILSNFDAWYPIRNGETFNLDSIRMYDGEGSLGDYPMTIYVVDSKWNRTKVATFTGSLYNEWVGPDPANPKKFALAVKPTDIKFIVINAWYSYPTELEFYGGYKAPAAFTDATVKAPALKSFFGVNAFEWDFEDPNNPLVIDPVRMAPITSFSGIRHYMDWQKLESPQGSFTYNPVFSGGWNYDTIYARCKKEGIEVLADLKTLPDWMLATYPSDQQDAENTPLRYGKDFSDPNSYIEQAKVAFQYTARYGRNANVRSSLLSVNGTPRWTNDPPNQVKKGLNLIQYIECDNERDKWWKGRKAYQTGREYAANLSAFYDGNKNTMGEGVGVKNADSTMKVVMGGLASANVDYVRGMIDWCVQYRGYKADGSVNLCWDVINYHFYSNDAHSSQNGSAQWGAAPELGGTDSVANAFMQMAHRYAADMPIWVTEAGYDVNNNTWSTQKVPTIGSKSDLLVEADWILRTSLLYSRSGVQKLFLYQLYDDNPGGGTFGSSGLLNADHSRRPAADFIRQVNKLMGNYSYQATLSKSPFVDRYAYNDLTMYALYMPTQSGKTATYALDLGLSDSAYIYTPQAGSDNMTTKKVKTTKGKLSVAVTETPVFVRGIGTIADSLTSFTGSLLQKVVSLAWTFSTNLPTIATKTFSVERSTDSVHFTAIGTVTGATASYAYTDLTPVVGKNYYRLKEVTPTAISYAKVLMFQIATSTTTTSIAAPKVVVLPNPVSNTLTIRGLSAKTTNLTLVNTTGSVLMRQTVIGSDDHTWDARRLAKGVYYIVVESLGVATTRLSFIKL